MLAIDQSWSRLGVASLLSVYGGAPESVARQQGLMEANAQRNMQANWGRSATMKKTADEQLAFVRWLQDYEEYQRRNAPSLEELHDQLVGLSDRIDAAKAKRL